MRFLVDNQLPAALARWLTAQGHDAIHVLDVALAQIVSLLESGQTVGELR